MDVLPRTWLGRSSRALGWGTAVVALALAVAVPGRALAHSSPKEADHHSGAITVAEVAEQPPVGTSPKAPPPEPVADAPAEETHAAEEPDDEAALGEEAGAGEPVAAPPAVEKLVVEEPVVEELVVEGSNAPPPPPDDAHVAKAKPRDKHPEKDCPVKKPPVKKPPVKQPPVKQPPVKQPPVKQPPVAPVPETPVVAPPVVPVVVVPPPPAEAPVVVTVTPAVTPAVSPVAKKPRVRVTKRGPAKLRTGGTARFRIRVVNLGEGDAFGIRVTDVLPRGFSLMRAGSPRVRLAAGRPTWRMSRLRAGHSRTVYLQVRADRSVRGARCNRVTVRTPGVGASRAQACFRVKVRPARRSTPPVTG